MTVLFVCTGNTCRSPMAACLFNALCQRTGRDDLNAASAGLSAASGMGASDGARRAMERRGLSLLAHRSRPVTEDILRRADLVVGMTRRHTEILRARLPGASVPMYTFDPPVSDPFGGGDELYELTAGELETQVAALFHLIAAEG